MKHTSLCLLRPWFRLTQYRQFGNMNPFYCHLIVKNILELYFHIDLTDGIYIAMHKCWQIPMKAIAQVWWCKTQGTTQRCETSVTGMVFQKVLCIFFTLHSLQYRKTLIRCLLQSKFNVSHQLWTNLKRLAKSSWNPLTLPRKSIDRISIGA